MKVYCERCDAMLKSRQEYDRHLKSAHSGMSCGTCVVDAFISRVSGFFKR